MIGEIRVKSLRITFIVTFIVIIFLSSGLVSALDSNGASVFTVWSNQTVNAGDAVTVRMTFQSNTDEQLQILSIGINFDWMPKDAFYGHDLSNNPVTIPSNGTYTFDPITIKIPSNASAGSHTYYVGVDGVQGSSGTFSWDSAASTIQVYAATGSSPTPTATSSPSSGGGQEEGPSLLLYLAVTAVVVIVALSTIVVVMRKRRKQAVSIAD